MTLQQLQYFRTTAKMLHYTKAAQALHISQPSLSASLAELERELKVPLFIKEKKKVALSWYGEIFLNYVEQSLDILNDGVKKIESLQGMNRGSIRLGYFHSISAVQIPDLVKSYYEYAGNNLTSFYFMMDQQKALISALKSGQIDLALCPSEDEGIICQKVWTQELFLVAPADHKWCGLKSAPLKIIDGEPFITMDKNSGIRHFLDGLFRTHDIHPNYIFETNECASVLTYVSLGLGVAIIPYFQPTAGSDLTYIKLSEPECRRNIYLSWVEDRPMNQTVCEVRDFILNHYSGMNF